MPSKRKTKARGRPQLDSGDDTDHGGVVSATGKTTVKVVAKLSTEEEQQMVERLEEHPIFYIKYTLLSLKHNKLHKKFLIPFVHIHCNNK